MAPDEKIAVLSDIHGNRWALEAVLDDIASRGISRMVDLGDCCWGPLDPAGTAEILMDIGMPTVRGNEDRLVTMATPSPAAAFVRERLTMSQLRWLEALPVTALVEDEILLCHGTPQRDDEYLLRAVSEDAVAVRPAAEVAARLGPAAPRVLLCGHDHLPGRLRLPSGLLVANPGSVGLQAYTDDVPHEHAIENGSPHARYAVLYTDGNDWHVEGVEVAYDWDTAADTALGNGRPDWALWLRSGHAAG